MGVVYRNRNTLFLREAVREFPARAESRRQGVLREVDEGSIGWPGVFAHSGAGGIAGLLAVEPVH